jgi:hypothetical protein
MRLVRLCRVWLAIGLFFFAAGHALATVDDVFARVKVDDVAGLARLLEQSFAGGGAGPQVRKGPGQAGRGRR